MARVAHAMARESSKVLADVIEIQEYPQLAQVYQVRGVPKTIINDSVEFTGAVPEEVFVQNVLKAAGVDIVDGDSEDEPPAGITPIR